MTIYLQEVAVEGIFCAPAYWRLSRREQTSLCLSHVHGRQRLGDRRLSQLPGADGPRVVTQRQTAGVCGLQSLRAS